MHVCTGVCEKKKVFRVFFIEAFRKTGVDTGVVTRFVEEAGEKKCLQKFLKKKKMLAVSFGIVCGGSSYGWAERH